MKFKILIQALESRLGYHHIPYNRNAVLLQDLFDNSPVHADFVTNFIRTIYKKNRCQTLESPITKSVTNRTLAKSRLAALHSRTTDIDTFNFIEELCLAIDAIFEEDNEPDQAQKMKETQVDQQSGQQNVVSIDQKRHLRWLKSSA